MERTRTGFCRKAVSAVTLLMMLLSAGCASDVQFDTVASNLECGGTFYQVYTENGTLSGLFDRYMSSLDKAIAESGLPQVKRDKIRRKLVAARWICSLFGFRSCTGFGASSVLRSNSGQPIYSNRIFIAVPETESCLPDWVLNRRNSDIASVTATLPKETFFSVAFNISVAGILRLFQEAGTLGEAMLNELPTGFPLELLKDVEGWCLFAAARRNGFPPQEDCMMVRIPDPEGKLFDYICRLPFVLKSGAGNPERREMNLRDDSIGLISPVMVRGAGMLTVYNSLDAEKLFTSMPSGSLRSDPHFIRYSAGLPEQGRAFAYIRELAGGDMFMSSVSFNGIELPVKSGSGFNVITRTAHGWLDHGNSDLDIPGEMVSQFLVQHLVKLLEVRDSVKTQAKAAGKKRAKRAGINCRKQFDQIYAELLKYAEAHNGKLPEISAAGFVLPKADELMKKVVCFGGVPLKSKDMPLVLDAPGRHRDSFCVLYADGTVKRYKLENPGSCRRMISFLYTVHRWEVKRFQHLMQQAQSIDEASAKKE